MNKKIIASNGYIGIMALIDHYGDINGVKTDESNRIKKLYFNAAGDSYFKINGRRYYLRDFIKTDILTSAASRSSIFARPAV